MSLEKNLNTKENEGLLSRISNKIKKSATIKIATYGIAASFALGSLAGCKKEEEYPKEVVDTWMSLCIEEYAGSYNNFYNFCKCSIDEFQKEYTFKEFFDIMDSIDKKGLSPMDEYPKLEEIFTKCKEECSMTEKDNRVNMHEDNLNAVDALDALMSGCIEGTSSRISSRRKAHNFCRCVTIDAVEEYTLEGYISMMKDSDMFDINRYPKLKNIYVRCWNVFVGD